MSMLTWIEGLGVDRRLRHMPGQPMKAKIREHARQLYAARQQIPDGDPLLQGCELEAAWFYAQVEAREARCRRQLAIRHVVIACLVVIIIAMAVS